MTWTKTGRLPRFTSASLDEAKREARRLAKNNPGLTFVVLRGVEKVHYGDQDRDGPPLKHPDRLRVEELSAQLAFAVKLLNALPGFRGTAQVEAMEAALQNATPSLVGRGSERQRADNSEGNAPRDEQ